MEDENVYLDDELVQLLSVEIVIIEDLYGKRRIGGWGDNGLDIPSKVIGGHMGIWSLNAISFSSLQSLVNIATNKLGYRL